MLTDVIDLVSETTGVDEYGDITVVEKTRRVFAEVQSIGLKEFYQASAVGLQPEIKFMLQDYLDYAGELRVRHSGTEYRVLRTYRNGQRLELTCYKEVHRNGAS